MGYRISPHFLPTSRAEPERNRVFPSPGRHKNFRTPGEQLRLLKAILPQLGGETRPYPRTGGLHQVMNGKDAAPLQYPQGLRSSVRLSAPVMLW